MASSARIDEIKKKFDENPRRYFAPLANEFRKAGDLEQAILICEEFLPQQAGHMSGHIVYGQALYEAGRLPESRTVFETALGLDPENLIALRHLGDIARGQGDQVEARRWYDRVLEADPRNEEIQGLLASLDPASNVVGTPVSEAAAAPSAWAGADMDLAPIDLELDESGSGATPPPIPAAAATPPPLGMPVPVPATPAPDAPFGSIALDGLQSTSANGAAPAGSAAPLHARAEGLEPAEFESPTTRHDRAEGLEPSEFEVPTSQPARAEGLETAEFAPPSSMANDATLMDLESSFAAEVGPSAPHGAGTVSALPGLEETGSTHPPAVDEPRLPSLDLDEGLAVPTHGDAPDVGSAASLISDVPLGQAAGRGAENPRMEPPAAMEAMPALETSGATDSMLELTPSVIAAESQLMDADEFGGLEPEQGRGSSAQAPFVTETMADLYYKQGFHSQALDVYRQLSAASPGDARLRARVSELEGEGAASAPAAVTGPTVREFLLRLANRRPGERASEAAAPSPSDWSSFDAVPEHPLPVAQPEPAPARAASTYSPLPDFDEPEPAVSAAASNPLAGLPMMEEAPSASAMPSPTERATTAQGGPPAPTGTIDALFGNRAASTSTDSAASALAQAFGGTGDMPVISGKPARAASGELSLDSVFRDGPARAPRVSQSFSFDQFFSENAGDAAATAQPSSPDAPQAGEPAERNADDVKQFNSWLQGLKPR